MAAAPDPRFPNLIELRHVNGGDLDPILQEEAAVWKSELDWDFTTSAALVRHYTDTKALSGHCLLASGRAVGYCYFVTEDHKGLLGDLYILAEHDTVENESKLLTSVVDLLVRAPSVKRIESQLMMLRHPSRVTLPHWRYLEVFQRDFMQMDLARLPDLPPGPANRWTIVDRWTERCLDDAGKLVADSYRGHVDSKINDQYRSPGGARRFLANIIDFPGCGAFCADASFVAYDFRSRKLTGMCLGSMLSHDIGHITQVCVSRSVRGKGLGYELMRRSMEVLARAGCRKVSLTVTSSNKEAIRLYRQMGFEKTRGFAAHIWDGF